MFATVVCLSGVSMLAPLAASAAVVDGSLISSNAKNSDGTPTLASLDTYIVKIVGNKKFKRLIVNPQIFNSYQHLKWSDIQEVDQSVLDSYTTSSLARVDGDSKVYALTPLDDTGAKSWINLSAAQFLGEPQSDPDSIYTINSTDAATFSTKADLTTVTQLKAFYKDGTLPGGVVSGDLTVSLSAATPESMSVPIDSSAEFAAIKLAAGSKDVIINTITVTASGFGTATNLKNVALYIDGAKVGSTKTTINSEKEASFNFSSPIEISANGSKTLTIKASAHAAGSYKLGIKEAADVITAGGTVGGSFPIYGNAMSADANVTTGHVTMSNASVETADTTNSFGEDGVLLAGFDLLANHEGAIIDSIKLKNGGTNQEEIISNLKLNMDGDEIAEGSYDAATGYVTFDVNGGAKITKDESSSFEVYGDLGIASKDDTIKLYVKSVDDFAFTGEDYGFGVQLDAIPEAINAAGDAIIVTLATGDITIDMDLAATPAKDVKADTDNVVLGTFSVKSNGEDATLTQIVDGAAGSNFEIQGTDIEDGDIENVEMRDTATGAIYDVASTFVGVTQWTLSMTDEINLAKGVEKTFEIRADLNSTIDPDATLKVVVEKGAMSITGDVSDAAITDIAPASVSSALATVKTASLTWSTTAMNAKTVVAGAKDVVIYKASLEAGTVDPVKLSSVTLTTNGAGILDDFTDSNISSVSLYLNGVKIKTVDGIISESAVGTPGHISFTSLLSTGEANIIPAGKTVTLEARADFAGNLTATAGFSLEINHASNDIVVRDAADNVVFAETVGNVGVGSRTITAAAKGNLKAQLLTTSSKDSNSLLLAGSTTISGKYLGEIKFTTTNEAVKLTELKLAQIGGAADDDIAEIQLVDSKDAVVATKIPAADGDANFTDLSITLPADQTTSYFIAVKAKGMNVDGDEASTADQNADVQYEISDVTANGVDSSLDIPMAVDGGATFDFGEFSAATVHSNTAVISGSVLNSITSSLSDGKLQSGLGKTVGKYTLVFDNGSNRTAANDELKAILKSLDVTVTKSAATTIAAATPKIYIEGQETSKVTGAYAAGVITFADLSTLADSAKVDGSVTLIITADITLDDGTVDTEYVQTSIADTATDLVFYGDGGTTAVANNYLPYTEVLGGTLSE